MVTMSGMLSFKEFQAMREEERQALIKKYTDQGYWRSFAEVKADMEIEEIRKSNIEKLTAFREIGPLY